MSYSLELEISDCAKKSSCDVRNPKTKLTDAMDLILSAFQGASVGSCP